MSRTTDTQDLIELGLDAKRLAKHTDEEIKLALCAIQESGTEAGEATRIELGMTEEEIAAHYAESALGW